MTNGYFHIHPDDCWCKDFSWIPDEVEEVEEVDPEVRGGYQAPSLEPQGPGRSQPGSPPAP